MILNYSLFIASLLCDVLRLPVSCMFETCLFNLSRLKVNVSRRGNNQQFLDCIIIVVTHLRTYWCGIDEKYPMRIARVKISHHFCVVFVLSRLKTSLFYLHITVDVNYIVVVYFIKPVVRCCSSFVF